MGKCASSMNFVKSAFPHDIMRKNLFPVISWVLPGYTGDSPVKKMVHRVRYSIQFQSVRKAPLIFSSGSEGWACCRMMRIDEKENWVVVFLRRRSRRIFWGGYFFFEMMRIDEKRRDGRVLRFFMMR